MPRQQFGTLFSQDSRNRTGDTQRALKSLMGASQFGGPLSTYDQIMRQMKRYQPVQPMPGRSQYLLPETMYWQEVNQYRQQIRQGADPNKLMEGYAERETARQKQKIEEQKIQAEYAKIGGELAQDIEGRAWEREKWEAAQEGSPWEREKQEALNEYREARRLNDTDRMEQAERRIEQADQRLGLERQREGRAAEEYEYEYGRRPFEEKYRKAQLGALEQRGVPSAWNIENEADSRAARDAAKEATNYTKALLGARTLQDLLMMPEDQKTAAAEKAAQYYAQRYAVLRKQYRDELTSQFGTGGRAATPSRVTGYAPPPGWDEGLSELEASEEEEEGFRPEWRR